MTLKEIELGDFWRIVFKEIRIGMMTGSALAVVNFIRIYYFIDPNMALALTVSIALMAIVIMAKVFGCLLPILAKVLKLDPAIMSAPMITTLVDAFGLIIYFLVAEQLLNLLV